MSHSLQSHRLYSPWNYPGQNTEVGSFSLLPGIFPTQGSNPCLTHCRRILYQLSNKGSPPYQLNLGTILNLLLSFQQSSQHLHKERILSQEIIYSTSIRSNSSSVSVLLGDCSDSVTSSQSPFLILVLLWFSTPFAVTSSPWSLEPLSYPWGLQSTSFKFLLMLEFWPLPMNHKFS